LEEQKNICIFKNLFVFVKDRKRSVTMQTTERAREMATKTPAHIHSFSVHSKNRRTNKVSLLALLREEHCIILEQWGATAPHPLPAHGHLAWSFQRQANIFHIIDGFLNRRGRHIVSRFEALLPHGQPRLTLGEMRLPVLH
jgi:hypothetical protein